MRLKLGVLMMLSRQHMPGLLPEEATMILVQRDIRISIMAALKGR